MEGKWEMGMGKGVGKEEDQPEVSSMPGAAWRLG